MRNVAADVVPDVGVALLVLRANTKIETEFRIGVMFVAFEDASDPL
jgi:hypothetical protein